MTTNPIQKIIDEAGLDDAGKACLHDIMQRTIATMRKASADAAINLGDAYRDLDPEMQRRVVFALEEILCSLGARPG